jgi:hypothetical protein
MSQNNSFASEPGMWLRDRVRMPKWWLSAGAVLIAFAVVGSMTHAVATSETATHGRVKGAGKTIIEGGTGGTAPLPVITTVAFHATSSGGDFECLAFIPPSPSGAGSGDFSVNAMYVTGSVTSVQVNGNTAILRGFANVTGLGAGTNVPFQAQVVQGGPGTTIQLQVSGLTFHEILLEGHVTVQSEPADSQN